MSNFYFDIETVTNPEAVALLGPVKPDSRLKDPQKILASIAEKTAARTERGALDCDTAQVVAIGWEYDKGPTVFAGENERLLLDAFWTRYAEAKRDDPDVKLCGFNAVAFDMTVLLRAAQRHNLTVPEIQLGKYRHPGILDLMLYLTWDGLVDAKSLTTYCRLLKIDVPDDPSTGADIAGLVERGDWEGVRAHCSSDIVKTRLLAERLGV